jgi:hypothetical protein
MRDCQRSILGIQECTAGDPEGLEGTNNFYLGLFRRSEKFKAIVSYGKQ